MVGNWSHFVRTAILCGNSILDGHSNTCVLGAYHDYDEIYGDVRLLSAMLSAIGLVLITRSFRQVCKPTQSKPKPAVSLNVAAGGHLSGRGLPPKTPFLTLPSFGFLYATFLCPILVFLVLTHTGPTPKVLFVFLLKPGSDIIT